MDDFVDEFGDGGENFMASPGKSDWEIVASEPMSPAFPSTNGLEQMEEASHEEQTKRKRPGVGEEDFMILDNSGFDEYFAPGIVPLSASGMVGVEDRASCSSVAAGALPTHSSLQGATAQDAKKQETLNNVPVAEPMSPAFPSTNGLEQMEEASHEEPTKRKRPGVGEEDFMILDNSGFDEYFAPGIVPLSASGMVGVEDRASCSSVAAGALPTHSFLQGGTAQDAKKQETLSNVPVAVVSFELGAVDPHPTSMGRGNNQVLEVRDQPLLAKPEEEGLHYQFSDVDACDCIEGIFHESVRGNEVLVRESQRLHDSPTPREQELNIGHIGQPSDMLDSEHLDATSNNNIDQNDKRGYASLTFAWLQHQLGQWCAYIRCTKTICSVALAAALVGLLVLGQGLWRMHSRNGQLQTLLFAKEKQLLQLMHQLMQLKEALTRRRQVPVIWSKIFRQAA